jgi:hypothetical protein
MVHVSRVDLRAAREKQIDDGARCCEMEWRLAIASTFMHARWIVGDQPSEEVRASEMSRRASIGDGTGCDQSVCGGTRCRVERMKSARPPIAPPVRVGPEVEEHVDHRWIACEGYDGRRIESEQSLVDPFAELRVPLEEDPHRFCITAPERVMHALFGRSCSISAGFDVLLERRPVAESVFAGEDELGICEGDLVLVRQYSADAGARLSVAGLK